MCTVFIFFLVKSPEGYFDVFFTGKVASNYKEGFSFKSVSQYSIMCRDLESEDEMHKCRCILEEDDQFRLFDTNPLLMGFVLDHISSGNLRFNNQCTYLRVLCIGMANKNEYRDRVESIYIW